MKAKPVIFSGMVLIALCLATPGRLRADNATSQPDTANPHQFQYSNPDANSSMTTGQSGTVMLNQNQPPAPVNRARSLIGMKVINQSNQTLGKVRDVVLDLQSGKIAYVVLEKAGRTHGTGANISVPGSAFTPSTDSRYLILNADKSRLQNTWGFSGNNYPPMGNSVYGAQPVVEHEHIIIVPVPSSPDPDQSPNLNPDQDHERSPSPGSDIDSGSF